MSAENPALDDIALLIRLARKDEGLTQNELAVMAGCSLITVQNIERGIGNPTITVLGQIMVALKRPQMIIGGNTVTFSSLIREKGMRKTAVKRAEDMTEDDILEHQKRIFLRSRTRQLMDENQQLTPDQAEQQAAAEWKENATRLQSA